MNAFLSEVRGALVSTVLLALVCCGVYPLAVFGLGQLLFRDQANGSLILDQDGIVRGSRLIGQNFAADRYFHPRPSAAGNGYAADNSGGSNLGPTSKKLNESVRARIEAYRKENGLTETDDVPADAVTASGSGLDPHISVRNADRQAPRVARVRGMDVRTVRELIHGATDKPGFGILGEQGVNVLTLNLALDRASGR